MCGSKRAVRRPISRTFDSSADLRAQGSLKSSHQERSGNPFSRHIANCKCQLVRLDRLVVIVVSGDDARRLTMNRYLQTSRWRCGFWIELRLYFPGDLEFGL